MKIGELIDKLIELESLYGSQVSCGYEDDCRAVNISEVSYNEKEEDIILK